MTNKIALFLGLAILMAIVLDLLISDGAGEMFLAQKFLALIDWVIFWH